MTVEQILLAASVVAAMTLLFLWRSSWPLLAGVMWSALPIYGAALPDGWGLGFCLTAQAVLAVAHWRRPKTVDRRLLSGGIALGALGLYVAVYEYLDPPQVPAVALTVLAGMTIAVLLCVTASASSGPFLSIGLATGGLIMAVAEIARVLAGGAVHTPEAAFGLNPIVLAQYSMLTCLIAAGLATTRRLPPLPLFAIAMAGLAGVVATGSRGPLIGLAVGLLLMFVVGQQNRPRGSRVVLRSLVVLYFGVLLWLVSDSFSETAGEFFRADDADRNGGARILLWEGAHGTIADSPWLGGGPGRFFFGDYGAERGLGEYPHNIFLELWSEYGIIPLLLLLVGVGLLFKTGGRQAAPLMAAVLVAFSFSGSLRSALILWVVLGVFAALSSAARHSVTQNQSPSALAMATPSSTQAKL